MWGDGGVERGEFGALRAGKIGCPAGLDLGMRLADCRDE